jgi:GNAT superfamily N-acetyltransferase
MPAAEHLTIRLIENDDDLKLVFPVLQELRPTLDLETFKTRVHAAAGEGFRLAALFDAGSPVAVTGYRTITSLNTGPTLYVDDLVTTAARRGQGYGEKLFAFLCNEGKKSGCSVLTLDSGYPRRDAHRFYLNRGMAMVSHHFAMKLI